jgi:hypothetical protein
VVLLGRQAVDEAARPIPDDDQLFVFVQPFPLLDSRPYGK